MASDLIALAQSAFVSSRQIQDNISVVQQVLHRLRIKKRKKKFRAILKLDMKRRPTTWLNGIS